MIKRNQDVLAPISAKLSGYMYLWESVLASLNGQHQAVIRGQAPREELPRSGWTAVCRGLSGYQLLEGSAHCGWSILRQMGLG